MEHTRRKFLAQSAGALGLLFLDSLTPQLIAQAAQHAQAATAAGAQSFKFLTPQEGVDFDAFSAQIIPSSDGTPGAHEAGAVYFADYVLSAINPEQQQGFRDAMALLQKAAVQAQPGVASFSALSLEKQIEVMSRMEKPPGADAAEPNPFANPGAGGGGVPEVQAFGLLRMVAVTGTFCDPSLGGNRLQVGWKLLGFDDQSYWAPPFGYYDAHAEEKA